MCSIKHEYEYYTHICNVVWHSLTGAGVVHQRVLGRLPSNTSLMAHRRKSSTTPEVLSSDGATTGKVKKEKPAVRPSKRKVAGGKKRKAKRLELHNKRKKTKGYRQPLISTLTRESALRRQKAAKRSGSSGKSSSKGKPQKAAKRKPGRVKKTRK